MLLSKQLGWYNTRSCFLVQATCCMPQCNVEIVRSLHMSGSVVPALHASEHMYLASVLVITVGSTVGSCKSNANAIT